uniref:Uncharacterized protein n=1 Tax=Rhizophora mucronata TaxID=61149 RepID=A0A2P2ISY7_RHIMU
MSPLFAFCRSYRIYLPVSMIPNGSPLISNLLHHRSSSNGVINDIFSLSALYSRYIYNVV